MTAGEVLPHHALPANPLSIELTLSHRRFWWQIDDEDEQPEQWTASADVCGQARCPTHLRHVGEISVAIAGLDTPRTILDAVVLGEWAEDFLAAAVSDPTRAGLGPELADKFCPGPPRVVILRRIGLAEPWRGHGLGAGLIASTLRILAPVARFAACQVTLGDVTPPGTEPVAAEFAAARLRAMLERIGFWRWRGVHLVDLHAAALYDARMPFLPTDESPPGHSPW
jgi:GNAT superfamily N-acetyltransferase